MSAIWPAQVQLGYEHGVARYAFLPTALLLEGDSDLITGKSTSPFSRNLVVIDAFKDGDKDKTAKRLSLRGRDLRYAIFDRSDFTGADFTAAQLEGARLKQTTLKDALFGCAIRQRWTEDVAQRLRHIFNSSSSASETLLVECSYMRYASFGGRIFEGVVLKGVAIDHVNFSDAKLRKIDFSSKDLTGVDFAFADVREADFSATDVIGARFWRTKAERANFNGSHIVFSDMRNGSFDLAAFNNSEVVLSVADDASFIGADLTGTKFFGITAARLILWSSKITDIDTFALGNISNAKFDETDLPKDEVWHNRPYLVEKGDAIDEEKKRLSSYASFMGWRSTNSYRLLKAYASVNANTKYRYIADAEALTKQVICDRDLRYSTLKSLDTSRHGFRRSGAHCHSEVPKAPRRSRAACTSLAYLDCFRSACSPPL